MNIIRRILTYEFPFVLASPALLWQIYFLYIPLIFLLGCSFTEYNAEGVLSFTLLRYQELLNWQYGLIILNSLSLALFTAFVCLVVGYPVAYFLAVKAGRFRTVFLAFLILPSWTSFIVQVYAWFFLLKKNGLIISMLHAIGLFSESNSLLHTTFASRIGMVYCYLPFMVFPLFAVLERMDTTLLEASADLGATRFETFKRIVLPLSMPGVFAGIILVFVPAFGEFVIPELLGGSKQLFIGSAVVDKFITFRNWQSGSATVMLCMLLPLLAMMATCYSALWLRRRKMRPVLGGHSTLEQMMGGPYDG